MDDIYKQLFYQYFDKLHQYAFTILKDEDESKDVVQTAFIKLWEKRGEVNMAASGKSYLYTSVYRLSLNCLRSKKVKDDHRKNISIENSEVIYNAEASELQKRILQSVEQLPSRCREVFYKSRIEGKKYAEIATEMKISVKTVEVQIGKALKFLRDNLSDLITLWLAWILLN